MSTHNKPFSIKKFLNYSDLLLLIFSEGLKNEFETAKLNESLVFEPLKVYCNYRPKCQKPTKETPSWINSEINYWGVKRGQWEP